MSGHDTATHTHDEEHVHVVSAKLLLTVFGLLIFLTAVTVGVSYLEQGHHISLGRYSILVALIIATVKAVLVAVYFMHLRWDKPFHALTLIGALLFVSIFIAFTIYDSREYKENYTPTGGGQVMSTKYGY